MYAHTKQEVLYIIGDSKVFYSKWAVTILDFCKLQEFVQINKIVHKIEHFVGLVSQNDCQMD